MTFALQLFAFVLTTTSQAQVSDLIPEPVTADQRDLIAVVGMEEHAQNWRPLYRYEERHTLGKLVRLADAFYRRTHLLARGGADLESFLATLQESELNPQVRAIDVFLDLHGHPGEICFNQQVICLDVPSLAQRIRTLPGARGRGPEKIRMFYDDSCYGSTHAQALLAAGFKTVSGARKESADRSSQFFRFLSQWVAGKSFAESMAFGNRYPFRRLVDLLVHNGGSFKNTYGDPNLTITSEVLPP